MKALVYDMVYMYFQINVKYSVVECLYKCLN